MSEEVKEPAKGLVLRVSEDSVFFMFIIAVIVAGLSVLGISSDLTRHRCKCAAPATTTASDEEGKEIAK